jgi:hypothetical protein
MNSFNLGWKASHSVYQILQFYLERIVSISNSMMLHSVDLYNLRGFQVNDQVCNILSMKSV